MRALGIRVPVVLGAMALVLSLLLGGQFLYNRQAVDQPLTAMYRHQAGVQSVQVHSTQAGVDIRVKLGLVTNLRQTYRQLQKRTTSILNGAHFTIDLVDSRTPQLTADYYKLDPILMEGLATGRFVTMVERAQTLGKQLGLDRTQVIPGQQTLYVELVQGRHYLYDIIARQPRMAAGSTGGGGST